jgi:hypothetical protein
MATFHGSIDELKETIAAAAILGEWHEKPNNCWRMVLKDRSGLNWSSSKGTIWFDGPNEAKANLEAATIAALNGGKPPAFVANATGTIFVSMATTPHRANS